MRRKILAFYFNVAKREIVCLVCTYFKVFLRTYFIIAQNA